MAEMGEAKSISGEHPCDRLGTIYNDRGCQTSQPKVVPDSERCGDLSPLFVHASRHIDF